VLVPTLRNTVRTALAAALATALALLVAGTASAAPPGAATGGVSSLSTTSAKLDGTVNPGGQSTSWYFEFGPTSAYGTKTASASAGAGGRNQNVSATISGLSVATTFHYRLVASNAAGTSLGADRTFTTQGPPAVGTAQSRDAIATTASVFSWVDPDGRPTTYHFDYGTTTSYGSRTPTRDAGSGTGQLGISEALTGLAPATTYHFRLVASNSAGTVSSADATFATVPAVTLTQSGFRVIAGHYVRLSGTVAGAQPGVSVTVLAQTFGAGSFAQLGTVLTGGSGTWSFLAQPRVATTYAASVNGSTSTSVTIGVQPGMTLTRITNARLSTRVAGATSFAGRFVKLQRFADGSWITVKQTRLNANSVAIFSAKVLPHGRSTIRVVMSVNQSGPGYLGGFSRSLTYTRS
jgi:hypothetical protein